jgi:His-Xaa-Ser system protein HxsD
MLTKTNFAKPNLRVIQKQRGVMETISELIRIIDRDHANIIIDTSLYDIEAINAACYAFTNNYHIIITRKDDTSVTVIFELKDKISQRNIPEDIKDFVNTVIDQQVRLQLDRANGKIRDLIVKHAFSPLDLKKEIKSL